jgi:hypothetical protein
MRKKAGDDKQPMAKSEPSKLSGGVNQKAAVAARQASRSPVRQASRSPRAKTKSQPPSADGKQRHPDAYLLATLEGPAVLTTVAGMLRAPHKNPDLVAYVLGNCHCLLGLDPAWESVLVSLDSFEQFMQKLRFLEQSSISQARLDLLQRRRKERSESFDPDYLKQVSHACAQFANFLSAVCARAGLKFA